MRKSELFDRCVSRVEQLLARRKLRLKTYYNEFPQNFFVRERKIYGGIIVSNSEGEAGIITRAWGIVFINPDDTFRCTDIHTSYYGESVALGKLWLEFEKLEQ